MIAIGHRGACGHEPENTLRSVRRALELGAAAIEVDVRFVENELLVIHDATLERTTNGRGRVSQKSLAELRALDAGKGERIPTLREVLDAVDRRAWVNIELKGRGTAEPVARLLGEYVREHGWRPEDFLVSSFRRRELREFQRTAEGGGIPIGVLFVRSARRFASTAAHFHASAIHPPLRRTTRRLVERAHALGLKVFVYTVNAPADIEKMRALGVDGVFTDFPERV